MLVFLEISWLFEVQPLAMSFLGSSVLHGRVKVTGGAMNREIAFGLCFKVHTSKQILILLSLRW